MNLPMVRTRPAPAPELAPAAAFWNDRDDCPDEGTAGRDIVDRVFNQHAARVDGTSSADKCRAAVDQIIREVA